jgi:hypothetical protein
VTEYGTASVFRDVDIPWGVDFRDVINEQLANADVMLVVIGKQWVAIKDDQGKRRLDNPSDLVRIEVETALTRKIRVIPVLVQGVLEVQEADLPESLSSLAFRNNMILSDHHFHHDMKTLIDQINVLFPPYRTAYPYPSGGVGREFRSVEQGIASHLPGHHPDAARTNREVPSADQGIASHLPGHHPDSESTPSKNGKKSPAEDKKD